VTELEAAKVLAVLATAFNHTVSTEEADVWFNACLWATDVGIAGKVCDRLVSKCQRWPTVAEWQAERRAVQAGIDPPRELAYTVSPQVGLDGIARAREILQESRWNASHADSAEGD
jgi:hypothetical protein